jgi:hypothetical protein
MSARSILGALALVFATSSVACAPAAEDAPPAPAGEEVGTTKQALGPYATAFVLLGENVLEAIVGAKVGKVLFPAPELNYDLIAQEFAMAIQQANVNQTVSTQKGIIQGATDTLKTLEGRWTNTPAPARPANAEDIYSQINTQIDVINQALGVLEQETNRDAGFAVYVGGVQVKLAMIAKSIEIKPESAPANRYLLETQATFYADLVAKQKADLMTRKLFARMWAFTECGPYNQFNDGDIAYTNDDGLTCNARRGFAMADASKAYTDKMSADLSWIDDVVHGWNQLANRKVVTVLGASYGDNVTPRLTGNVTSQVKMIAENGRSVVFDKSKVELGDPAYGQNKWLNIQYKCSPDDVRSAFARPQQSTVTFGCE